MIRDVPGTMIGKRPGNQPMDQRGNQPEDRAEDRPGELAGALTVELVDIGEIHETELTDDEISQRVLRAILRAAAWTTPIWIERLSGAVMDGHHRLKAADALCIRRLPCLRLDYADVEIMARRESVTVSPSEVLRRAREGDPYPAKSTRHRLRRPVPPMEAIPLHALRNETFSHHLDLVWRRHQRHCEANWPPPGRLADADFHVTEHCTGEGAIALV